MSWFDIALPLAVGLCYLFVPGLLIAAAARLCGFEAFGLAPALSIAAITIGAIVTPMVGIRWALWVPFATALVIALLVFGIVSLVGYQRLDKAGKEGSLATSYRLIEASPWVSKEQGIYWASFAVGAILLWRNVTNAIGQPDWVSQTWDNNFHLNAVRFIEDTGNASALTMGAMTSIEGESTFYPNAWHALVSLVTMGSSAGIPETTNAVALLVSAVLWPLSAVFLVRQVFKLNTAGTLVAGAFAAAFTAYPILLLNFGVLYPNLLGIALVPAGIGLVAQLFRTVEVRRIATLPGVILGIFVAFAIAISHPNAMMSLLVITIPLLLVCLGRQVVASLKYGANWKPTIALAIAVALIFIVINILWSVVRPPQVAGEAWGPNLTSGQALGEALSFASMGHQPQWFLTLAFAVGIYSALKLRRSTHLWVLGSWGIVAAFYIAGRSLSWDEDRYFWVGVWYHDSFRLAALLPIMSVPLLALGVHWVTERLSASLANHNLLGRSGRRSLVIYVVAVLAVVGMGQTSLALKNQIEASFYSYAPGEESNLLSTDEYRMLNHLDDYVPEGKAIVVQPFTGAALAYAIADRPVTAYHTIYTPEEDVGYIQQHLNRVFDDPKVCQALNDLNAGYYLDFGYQEVNGGDHALWYPGYEGLTDSEILAEIHREGDAVLYQITAC